MRRLVLKLLLWLVARGGISPLTAALLGTRLAAAEPWLRFWLSRSLRVLAGALLVAAFGLAFSGLSLVGALLCILGVTVLGPLAGKLEEKEDDD